MRSLRVILLAGAFTIASSIIASADADLAPYESVRILQQLQDRIATGDAIAQATHAKAIRHAAQAFARAPSSSWSDNRNARALVVYLFSGGSAATIADAVPPEAVSKSYEALYRGALAYGLGDDEKARALLLPIDAKTLPTGLGGHLALVQATLCSSTDQPKAIGLLDLARLLEPGTLVEEAALRKEMSLIGSSGNLDKFSLLARRYLNAFPQSVYAENFRSLVAQTAMQLGATDTPQTGGRLATLMAGLDKTERRRLYLAIAREALLAGRTVMAALASEEAGRLAQNDHGDEARAMIYFGAATIVGDRYDLGIKALRKVAVNQLDAKDQAIQASALAVAEIIRGPAVAAQNSAATGGARNEIFADAERSLAAADTMLKSAEK